MKRSHDRRQSTGFTLIELLVVIAIIALLIGILLPALSSAQESAKKLKCLTNVRSMGIAFTYYADDNRDWYPIIPNSQSNGEFLSGQWGAGGVAGLFSLFQVGDGEGSYNEVGGSPDNLSGDFGYFGGYATGAATYPTGERVPIMRGYLEAFEILTCPSDRLDYYWRFYAGSPNHLIADADAIKTPQAPTNEREIIHYNISYLYIAGLKQVDPSIQFAPALWGDETNTSDISLNAWYGWQWRTNSPGSGNEPDPVNDFGFNPKTGYAKDDNHGDAGGNFVRADGSASFIQDNPQRAFFISRDSLPLGEYLDPRSVNIINPNRSKKTQVID